MLQLVLNFIEQLLDILLGKDAVTGASEPKKGVFDGPSDGGELIVFDLFKLTIAFVKCIMASSMRLLSVMALLLPPMSKRLFLTWVKKSLIEKPKTPSVDAFLSKASEVDGKAVTISAGLPNRSMFDPKAWLCSRFTIFLFSSISLPKLSESLISEGS